MTQITARVPDELGQALSAAAAQLNSSRAEVVRLALQQFLVDLEDLALAKAAADDPNDPVLDWEDVKRELFDTD
ncbi:MAG: ribbon-helix-helix protein, CopG family [Chloroflexota bacterium]|nr:ribbon-helix-helix protein, CopG family [Chloroflexota bacterium]